ncbi:hypothetical protein L3Q82_000948 [Scortum barcoo]|uniref:Uncharacterized protein n=1 Tax=Scortum barcoo TaxID=214431 RepID=A0ACB8WB88_9TELE|nr:hypothetical protein L3Q82_000948 [Scortum barcoo]
MFSASIVDAGSSKLWTQGLWCLSWRQPPNPVVDTGSKGCCHQAEEGVPIGPCWPVGLLTQLTGTYRQTKQAAARTVLEAKTSGLGGVRAGGWGAVDLELGTLSDGGKKYFEDLLNPTDLPSNEEAEDGDSEVDSSITQAEVTECLEEHERLTRLCNIAWRLGTVPLEWQTGVVVPLFKKGDRRVCSNYRGSHFSASREGLHARVLERRIRPIVDPRIQEEQCGFRPGRGTLDQLYTLRRVLEGLWEFAQPVHMCFVDLEKAFDRVPRGILWGVLREYGVRGPLLRAVRSLYDQEQELGSHCRQISRRSQGPEGVRFGNHRISSLLFADDVVLLASSSQDLQRVLERFAAECEAAGMRISTSKSEAMVLDRKRVACPLRVSGRGPASSGGVQVSRGLVHE